MLAEGFATRNGRRGALIHRDAVNRILRGRRGARTTALTSGGTIPDTADYQVLLEPENQIIGTVNEDFAVESMAGDIFQLGNASYRIQRVERGTVRVEDAKGQPPNIPFWLGEAPGRTDELSAAVSRLRAEIAARLARRLARARAARRWLVEEVGVAGAAADQLVDYLAASALRAWLPADAGRRSSSSASSMKRAACSSSFTRRSAAASTAPGASRLRKRFCRKFNFELQAAATEDNIVLSLTTAHSFELGDVARYLHSNERARRCSSRRCWMRRCSRRAGAGSPASRLRSPAFAAARRFRRSSCACRRRIWSRRSSPIRSPAPRISSASGRSPTIRSPIRRSPTACMRRWTSRGWSGCFGAWRRAKSASFGCDLTEPSPLALEALSARPYAFLDDAPLEERRTQAVMARRWRDPQSASDLGRLDPEAIAKVQAEAWPDPVNAEELHDALLWLGCLTEAEAARGARLERMARGAGARQARRSSQGAAGRFMDSGRAARAIPRRLARGAARAGDRAARRRSRAAWSSGRRAGRDPARRLEGLGPVTPTALAAPLGLEPGAVAAALAALETRRRDPQGTLPRRRQRRAMVRPAPARAHPSLHGPAAALRDRAGRRARLSPLPVLHGLMSPRRRVSKGPTRFPRS